MKGAIGAYRGLRTDAKAQCTTDLQPQGGLPSLGTRIDFTALLNNSPFPPLVSALPTVVWRKGSLWRLFACETVEQGDESNCKVQVPKGGRGY